MNSSIRQIKEKFSVFSKCVDVDIDYQESLMSYHEDLLKVVRCRVSNEIINTDYNAGSITVYGKSKIFITYVSEGNGCLTTADFEEDFKKVIQLDCDCDDVSCDIAVVNKYNNFRVINQRRIDVHSCFALKINASCMKQIEMLVDDDELLIKKDNVDYLSFVGCAVSKSEFEDEAVIAGDSEVIRKVINSFYSVCIDDVKIIKDKMLVKLIAGFSFLYTTDTDNEIIKRCEKSISISKIVDINGIDEGDVPVISAEVCNLYVKPKADVNNELRVIDIIGDININSTVYRRVEAQLSVDSYSPAVKTSNSYNKISLNTNGRSVNDVINDSMLYEFENINIVEVLDLTVAVTGDNELELCAFVINDNSQVVCLTQSKKLDISELKSCKCYIKSFDYVIKSSASISVRYSIEYYGVDFTEKTFDVLSAISVDGEYDNDSPALVVYFANQNENLWDIAKEFRTSVDLIKKENEISNDVLDTARVLIIPGM